ncbi:MAG: hypothetical protein Q8K32_16645 [Archangium sp.]|nr:hypothetical protein [Archangium sp.]
MRNLLVTALLVCSSVAFAQEENPPPAVVVQPPPAAVHTLPAWNVGAGLGFFFGGPSFGFGSLSGLSGLAGLSSNTVYVPLQPQFTVLVERRLSERLFLTFQAAATYGANQDDTASELKGHNLNLAGAFGVRRVFNPRGVIEVSWFGNAGVGYTNNESRGFSLSFDAATASYVQTLNIYRSHTFSVGAVTGLTLERELIEGLALRLSSSIIGFSYGQGKATTTTPETKVDRKNHVVDVGLRFSPTIELRYAF